MAYHRSLAAVALLLFPSLVLAQGTFTRIDCNQIPTAQRIPNQTWCFEQSTGAIKVWNGASFIVIAPGVGGAPQGSSFVTVTPSLDLTAERVLTAGPNIEFNDTGPDGTLTVSAICTPPPGGGVAGTDTQVQFNDADVFGADASLTFNKSTGRLTTGLLTAAGLIYPAADGAPSTVIQTDGAGNLSFAAVSGTQGPAGPQGPQGDPGAPGVGTTNRTCTIIVGADNGSVLVNSDLGPQKSQCFISVAATVTEIEVAADGGTPNVIVRKDHLGTPTNLLSGALATAASGGRACANTGGTLGLDGATTCSNTLSVTTLQAGDYIELTSGTAGGVAKRMSISIVYSVTP